MAGLRLETPVQFVRGVGPQRAAEFARLGIHTVNDLIEHFPARHELRPQSQPIDTLVADQVATVVGAIRRVRSRSGFRRGSVVADVEDGTGRCRVRWFNSAYLRDRLRPGQVIRFTGKVGAADETAEFINPRFQLSDEGDDPFRADHEELVPVYPATGLLPSRYIGRIICLALSEVTDQVVEPLPSPLRARRDLPPRRTAIERFHRPTRAADVSAARRRLAYEELLLVQLVVQRRRQRHGVQRGWAMKTTPDIDRRIRRRFPFALTSGQDRAVADIVADLAKDRPMNRLLQADVGAGKTVVALYAALVAIANGAQVAMLAPTEVLARQHHHKIIAYLQGSRVRVGLLTGATSARDRRQLLDGCTTGQVNLLVGTHAVLEEDVTFDALGLVIIDEQHKFGVAQRGRLRAKGRAPHYLVLTATPIPRTLAMTFFGDLEVSTIHGLPPGRRPVETRLLPTARISQAWDLVRERLGSGEQTFIVYPLVSESETLPLQAATIEARRLRREQFPMTEVALLHGKMTSQRKQAAMEAFRSGRAGVLVTTTAAEVGVDVPNATVMVVQHAERYGLSQLHQLRGRIGRGPRRSHCLLVSDSDTDHDRLRVMCATNDGFRIAEEDLRLRGPGDFVGARQHGLPLLRVADLIRDLELLQAARADAQELLQYDPTLAKPEHAALRRALRTRFGERLVWTDAG